MTALEDTPVTPPPTAPAPRVPTDVFVEVYDFLVDEAALLDDDLHQEWLGIVADDITYQMPARKTLYRKDGAGFDEQNFHFDDDRLSLDLRVRRSTEIASAFDRDPLPRIRRLVTNVVVRETDKADEYAVTSSLLLLRSRFDAPHYDMLSGRREDIIRRTDDGLELARRLILLDQSALGAPFINVFM